MREGWSLGLAKRWKRRCCGRMRGRWTIGRLRRRCWKLDDLRGWRFFLAARCGGFAGRDRGAWGYRWLARRLRRGSRLLRRGLFAAGLRELELMRRCGRRRGRWWRCVRRGLRWSGWCGRRELIWYRGMMGGFWLGLRWSMWDLRRLLRLVGWLDC